jgi:fermentation-respiration switch protein FrsA (DUF1100 family)
MKIGRVILVGFVAILAGVLLTAQTWFYYPTVGRSSVHPGYYDLQFHNVTFSSTDGTKLHGWFIPAADNPKGVILHVHGNGGRLENHLQGITWLPEHGYSVFMFDYRGYGLSQKGRLTPKGLMRDTQGAIAYLKTLPEAAGQKILVIGQSIGGNNAIAAIANGYKEDVAGIVLDATFFSYSAIADHHVPWAGILMSDKYSAKRNIKQLAPIPIFFLHGERDRVVPFNHSRQLFELATSPKRIKLLPYVGHMALDQWSVREELLSFLADCLKDKKE